MKALLASLALTLTLGGCTAPTKKEEPNLVPTVTAAVTPRIPADPNRVYRVLPLGDSITKGHGEHPWNSYRKELKGHLAAAGMKINYVGGEHHGNFSDNENEGHGGWTINQIRSKAQGYMRKYNPDVVLLHAGTNDMSQNVSIRTAWARLNMLLWELKQVNPHVVIFVMKITGVKPSWLQHRTNLYNYDIHKMPMLGIRNIFLVDQSMIRQPLLWDNAHPNEVGYSVMAWNLYAWFRYVFSANLWPPVAHPSSASYLKLCTVKSSLYLTSYCYIYRKNPSTGSFYRAYAV